MTPPDPPASRRRPPSGQAAGGPALPVAHLRRTVDAEAIRRIAGDEATLAWRALENLPGVFLWILDHEMRLVSTREGGTVHGPSSDLLGRSVLELMPPAEAAQLAQEYGAALAGEEREFLFVNPFTEAAYDTTVGPLRDGDGKVVGLIVVGRDVTKQRKAERRTETLLERFFAAFENAPLPMVILNADGSVRTGNAKLRTMAGRTQEGIVGRDLPSLFDPRDRDRLTAVLPGLLSGETSGATVEARMLLPGEAPAECSLHITGRAADDEESGVTVHIVDMTEQRRHDAQLRYLAGHDTLTGLLNRVRFEEAIETHLDTCSRYGQDGAVVLVDVDHFKQINDAHGRPAGDAQLVEITGLIQRGLPSDATIGRLGGDEFGVLLPTGGLVEVMAVAERIRASAHDHARVARASGRVSFTLSIGVAAFTAEVAAPADVLVLAEHAVSAAKTSGRDRVAVPELVVGPGERRAQTAIGRLRRAIRDERFELHAQPIVRLTDDRVSQYELLVRMRDEDGELVPPGAFLPLAEHYGLIGEIDAWVVREGIAALAKVGEDITFQVNISGRSLGHPALLDNITNSLRTHAVTPKRLVFELTETAAIENVNQARVFAETLRDLGCELALDDFGSGFGGLHYLKHLPFTYLKIDGEFIADVATNETDERIVEG
ncbi:MAG: EAL domain-containing protein, partial [Solirubrobacteraceae bacterium]|nr:EAL domain-containing protein [Solirubrobacteraceae bacterium]